MTKFLFNKLFINKIPDIIKSEGGNANVKWVEGNDKFIALKKLLLEKVNELDSIEETKLLSKIVDIEDLLNEIIKTSGVSKTDLEIKSKDKFNRLGDFSNGCYILDADIANPIWVNYYKSRKQKIIN